MENFSKIISIIQDLIKEVKGDPASAEAQKALSVCDGLLVGLEIKVLEMQALLMEIRSRLDFIKITSQIFERRN